MDVFDALATLATLDTWVVLGLNSRFPVRYSTSNVRRSWSVTRLICRAIVEFAAKMRHFSFAREIAVYHHSRDAIRSAPLSPTMTTMGHSEPCDLWTVMAYPRSKDLAQSPAFGILASRSPSPTSWNSRTT